LDLNSPPDSLEEPQKGQSRTIVLVHHGHALGREIEPMQPLSGPGRVSSQHMAVAASGRGVRPDVIWHSGKFRARQTAELFWRACNPQAVFSVARGLQPTDPPSVIQGQLDKTDRSVLLVGHMPHLPRLLRVLCGELPDSATIDFPAHGCVALERKGGRWKQLWRLDAPPPS
jgi:phosphohistidine phosphatase